MLAGLLLFAVVPVLQGQGGRPIRAQGVRSLVFGTVLPGVPRTIPRTDPMNSAQFRLTGRRFSTVQLSFALPSAMIGPLGATMPLSFGGNDGGYSVTESVSRQVGFDPRAPFLATLSKTGRGSVFLGGTVQPVVAQRAGAYSGTVTLTVAYFP